MLLARRKTKKREEENQDNTRPLHPREESVGADQQLEVLTVWVQGCFYVTQAELSL